MKKLKVLFVAAELTPLAKVGGLADVVGALPIALKKLGVDVRIALPKYGIVDENKYPQKMIAKGLKLPFNGKTETYNVLQSALPKTAVPVYLIDHPEFLGGGGVYFENDASSTGNFNESRRFTFFVRAVPELFETLGWWPDVIHCHDWHVGILPALMKVLAQKDPRFKKPAVILTIHNMAYQGKYNPGQIFSLLNFKGDELPTLKLRFGENNDLNYLQQAILNCDAVNTVSPSYAQEILTAEYGEGLENTLKERKNVLSGILNGIDTDRFNPQKDVAIKTKFSFKTISKKMENKLDLQNTVGLAKNAEVPLLGMVSRLADQKGIELITEIMDKLATLDLQMVFLGAGLKPLEDLLSNATKKYPGKVFVKIGFDAHLAQKIYAGSDIFLMPSRFEPCGLGQMIAMGYGAVPIVRATGGLKDTVQNINPGTLTGTGFLFQNYNGPELLATIQKALKIYHNKKVWIKIAENGMRQDFSWTQSAQKYLDLYHKTIKSKELIIQ